MTEEQQRKRPLYFKDAYTYASGKDENPRCRIDEHNQPYWKYLPGGPETKTSFMSSEFSGALSSGTEITKEEYDAF